MDFSIDVMIDPDSLFIENGVISPLPVNPGDRVTWSFSGLNPGDVVTVEFHTFMPSGGAPAIVGPQSNPFGSQLSPGTGTKLGSGFTGATIGPAIVLSDAALGLYIYTIFLNGQPLHWRSPLFTAGSFNGEFGGLEVPRT